VVKRVVAEELRNSEAEGWIEVELMYPHSARKLLMVELAEKAAESTTVRSTKSILNAYGLHADMGRGEKVCAVQTEGVNFQAAWLLAEDTVDHKRIGSNDIWQVLQTYGVEAARQSIVLEINNVFGGYGIDVNPRHLSLIADFMTRTGSYVPMNRQGMMHCPSTLLQMSFETTCSFLIRAAEEGNADVLESPSARLVLGNVTKVGTGSCDVMVPLVC
jgi:DNA-directed RNA polymerase I subunit RPA1